MEPPMEANTFSTSGDAKLAPKPFSPNSDSWCLPPLHLIPTEPKDFGYVDMSFVGDPLVEPKKRPKWHQYGGHYRPVRPGIPWMPSPEITSPLPLPAHIKLPSEIAVGTSDESLDTNSFSLCTAETKIPVDSDTKKQREASIQSINKECDDGDVSLSSRSSSSEEDSSSVVNSLFCGNSNEIVADEISVVDRSGSSSPVAFDRTLFGGRPLYLGQENISLAGLGSHIADSLAISKDQGSSWVGKLKTIRKKILARLQRVESSTSRPGYHAAPVMNWASNVADAEDRENTSSLSLGASVSPQRHLTTPLLDIIPPHSSASSSIERDGESRHGADDQSSERGGPRPLLILQEDGQIEGLAARAFDLISLPPDSWMEDAEGKRPSSIHGAYAVDHSRSDLPENTAESIEQDRDPGIQGHSSLGLVYQDVESASGEDTSDSWLGLELSLVGRAPPPRLAVIDLPVLDAAPLGLEGLEDQLSSAWPEASTSVSDPLYSEHEDMPSLGLSVILAPLGSFEPTPATTNDISHDTLDVPSSNSPVWYFRPPLRPNSIEASDSLDWLTSSTAEPPLEANPKSTFKPNTFSEEGPSSSSDSDVLGGMARSEEECVFASGFAVNPSDLLWPERDHCSAIPHALHDHDALPMENLAYCHYTSAYTSSSNCGRIEESQQQTLTLDLDAAPVPLPLQKEDGGERAFVERVRRKQAQARDNRRIKFTRQQVKENAPDQQSLSKRLGLPGTQDWRRYVVTTPTAFAPLRYREYLSFAQAALQLEYYPDHHLETISLASWYHRLEQEQSQVDEDSQIDAVMPQAPLDEADSDDPANQTHRTATNRSSVTNDARVALTDVETSKEVNLPDNSSLNRLPLARSPQPPLQPRVRFEIDQELFIPPPLTPEASKTQKLYPDPREEQPRFFDLVDPSVIWTAHSQATFVLPEQQSHAVAATPPPDVQAGWPTLEQLQDEASKSKKLRRLHYEVPEQITNTALLMWYPPDLRDGQGPLFEVVPGEEGPIVGGASSKTQDESDTRDVQVGRASPLEPSIILAPLASSSIVVPFEEQTPALRAIELPPDTPPQPVDIIRLRRELKYRELPPANLPLPKIVCPHEWKAYGYFARPVIENVDMYNTPSPWLGHCNLDPDNPRDPYAPIKDVEATLWLDTDTTPEEMLFHLKDHPDDRPLPERWQVGVVHASLPPKPPRWETPEPDTPDASPFEVQLNPYLEHLLRGAQRMSWDIRCDTLMAYVGFQDYKGLLPLRPQDLAQPASFPFVKQMNINTLADDHGARLPWPVIAENPEGIKVRDVIFAIFRGFQKLVSQEEYSRFPEWRRLECAHWRERRCAPMSSESWARGCPETGTPEDGLKRIDWFGSRTIFQGLSPNLDGTGWVLFLGQRDSF